MKKIYNAPTLECLEFFSVSPIGTTSSTDPSYGWNDGEMGWNWT